MLDLNIIAAESDKAIHEGNKEVTEQLIKQLNQHLDQDISEQKKCYTHYILGNLYNNLSNIMAENPSGWKDDNYPLFLTSEINHLRKSKQLLASMPHHFGNTVKTNLANALARQRRSIEVIDEWNCDLSIEGDSSFVSSLSKAKELIWISHWLNDSSHQNLYRYEAYLLIKNVKENIAGTDHPKVLQSMQEDKQILSILSKGDELFKNFDGWHKDFGSDDYNAEEKNYRNWCLREKLFINPINDLTQEQIADQDIMQFPNHLVSIGEGPYLSASFSALKREFCFARFMAYEGFNSIHPSFENKKLFLTNTLDYIHYDGATEKIKTSFRICFSVLDSIAFLMNAYFHCGSKDVSFSSKWIKNNFKEKPINFFVDALYWLSCDLMDNPKVTSDNNIWKAPNPHASEIKKIRNAIEHGWLRVTDYGQPNIYDQGDFAYLISEAELKEKTLLVLKLVRSAIFYLYLAVSYNEYSKPEKDGVIVTMPVSLVEDDFIPLWGS